MDAILSVISLCLLMISVYGITIYYEKQYVSKCKIVYKVKK